MKLSIIVPTFNEESSIDFLLSQFDNLYGDYEVIFGDGGSIDCTIGKIGSKYPVVNSPKGRATQMNKAAQNSTGDVLLFLHCDSLLPKEAMAQILNAIEKGNEFGCFKIKFNSDKFLMKCCASFSNLRVKYRKIAFGDQGIFMTRRLFDEVGGFPDLPIMEDYKLSMMLKKEHKICQIDSVIKTSARRFEKGGTIKTMWKMQKLQYMFRHGADASKILELYNN